MPSSLPQGNWIFTHGLRLDYQRTGSIKSKDAAQNISLNAPWARDSSCCPAPAGYNMAGQEYSRELTYALNSYLDTEAMGFPKRKNKDLYLSYAIGHIDQWFVTRANPTGPYYIQPFMVGLTMRTLIQAYDETPAALRTADMLKIPDKIKIAIDTLWNEAWLPLSRAFFYATYDKTPAPDLNLMIAHAYAWYYLQTGNVLYRDRGDQIFSGGVVGSYLAGGKQFNQNYIYSFDYVKWRELADSIYSGGGTPPPPPPPEEPVLKGAMTLSSTSINFGKIKIGQSKQLTLSITNTGKGSLSVTVGSLATPMTIVSGGGAFVLKAGEARSVLIKFTPTTTSSISQSLLINSDDPAKPTATVMLYGRGR